MGSGIEVTTNISYHINNAINIFIEQLQNFDSTKFLTIITIYILTLRMDMYILSVLVRTAYKLFYSILILIHNSVLTNPYVISVIS